MAKKSKWVNIEKFKAFTEIKKEETEKDPSVGGNSFFLKWKNPEMGTYDREKTYKVRLLTDKNGDFYKKYFYHFFKTGETSNYIFCPKTHDINAFCPWCYISQLLFQGNASDKKKAYNYTRKERFVSNVFIVHDPRDADISDEKYKSTNTVRLYEFPATIEKLIKKEVTNDEEGYGYAIFDPENGYDLIIAIKAKKPDQNKKVWPDYSLTAFSRKSSKIAEDDYKIEEIMESVYDLTEYFKSLEISMDAQKKLLKLEELWEDVEEKFNQVVGFTEKKNDLDSVKNDNNKIIDPAKENDESPFKDEDLGSSDEEKQNEEVDEKELLNQLKNFGK